jgi:hypothetical protein
MGGLRSRPTIRLQESEYSTNLGHSLAEPDAFLAHPIDLGQEVLRLLLRDRPSRMTWRQHGHRSPQNLNLVRIHTRNVIEQVFDPQLDAWKPAERFQ